jgi:DNA-binding response OmpR family regulator
MAASNKPFVVLHVEDHADIRGIVTAALAPMGVTVLSAPDGLAGLELAIRETPDMILLDTMMPGMDGLTLCGKLRELPQFKTTPIFMLSTLNQSKDVERAMKQQATGYMTKPIDMNKLRHDVLGLIERKARGA